MQTCMGTASISSHPCHSWSQDRSKHGQNQELRGAGCRLGGSGKSPDFAPAGKLLHFDPFSSLETSCGTGVLLLTLLSEHFTALSVFFLLMCYMEMLECTTLFNMAARVSLARPTLKDTISWKHSPHVAHRALLVQLAPEME